MDSDLFWAAPTTTGGLKAYYRQYSPNYGRCDIELVHFRNTGAVANWQQQWLASIVTVARQAIDAGLQPLAGLSFYTWNAAQFLALAKELKESCPGLLIFAGGPHVQQAEDYLFDEHIDVIALGEGEATFLELMDCNGPEDWPGINGLAYLDDKGELAKTAARTRTRILDELPSALDVVPLTDQQGQPLYESYSYETSRGCPFKCSFCEWGTGAIGTKMYQFSMERVHRDWHQIINAGIKDIWLADSNFGALREDLDKAKLICELKQQTGLPTSFATSWSKKHSPRVQEIVMLLNQHGLLPHYQLALQTLTPLALELSNRKNMDSNKYEPIAKQMAEQGVPIAVELIWGLPGDNLEEFERNLDKLIATFPKLNIFGYTLLPGTEFYERRQEYQIDTIPVAGYGKAKGEYVVGCHTFDRNEGIEGYSLITAHILLNHGHIIPLTTRFLALQADIPVSPLMRHILREVINDFQAQLPNYKLSDRMISYENRDKLYLKMLEQFEACYEVIEAAIFDWLKQHKASATLIDQVSKTLQLDQAFCPRYGEKVIIEQRFEFDVEAVSSALEAMELPASSLFHNHSCQHRIEVPGGVGVFLKDPDGGSWMRGQLLDQFEDSLIAVQ